MDSADNFHSQLVAWSKIILPLCALGLLSTLFLFARTSADTSSIPFSEIETLAREQRINAPRFSGVADDGSIIAISAQSAQLDQNAPHKLSVTTLKLDVNTSDGSRFVATSVEGEVDSLARIARLRGLARLETSTGYSMETNGLVADLKSGVIASEGGLEVRAPFGAITAGQVTFQMASDNSGHQMVFTQGVRLIYTPNSGTLEEANK